MSPSDHDDEKSMRLKQINDEARTVRRIVGIVLGIIVLVIAVVGISGFLYIKSALKPVDPSDHSKENITIPIGSSVSKIATILEENEIIKDSRVFRYYIKFRNEAGFQAGEYQFSPSMNYDELIEALKTGKVLKEAKFKVTIPEGKTVDQIAGIYAKKLDFTKEDFVKKVNDFKYVEELMAQYPTLLTDEVLDPEIRTPLEGYLFASTYSFYKKEPTINEIVEKMLSQTKKIVNPYLASIKEKGLTIHEALTFASLVENEARTKKDRKLIAGVFYNRLEIDMALQTDPTVLYALGEHKDRVLHKDLEVESPYNTYRNTGLPIGPISNFSENSLEASINPTPSDYLYFIAASNGEIYYAKNFNEHIRLKNKYLK